jgi:hypothetical protein
VKAPAAVLASDEYTPSQTFSLAANYSVNSRTLLAARFGYKYLNGRTGNYNVSDVPFVTYRTPSSTVADVPAAFQGASGFATSAGAFVVDRDITTRHNLYLDGSRVVNVFGQQHIFKAGYALNRIYNDVVDGYANGRFDIFWGETFSRGAIAADRGRYGYYIWEDGPRHNSQALGRNHGLYVQDTWRVRHDLTLSLGVRLEREFVPPYRAEFNGHRVGNPIDFGWDDKIAPRLGAAWDVRGDGKWKLSGSYGLFYDLMKYAMARAAFGGSSWISHVYRLDEPDVLALNLRNPGALGTRITSFDNRSIPVNERGEWAGIDPDLKPFTSRELTVSLERRLASRLAGSVRYTRKNLLRAIEDIGLLDENGSEVYLIGNPGFGLTRNPGSVYGGSTPDGREFLFPRAKRQYDAVEFRLEGDLHRFHLLGSYTYSRLFGNYSGLANSDEAGRMEPSISRSFDLPTYYFDSSGRQRNVEGRLATDRPHVAKLYAWREVSNRLGDTSFGLTQIAMSGTLDSTTVSYLSAPTFPNGRGDLGRTAFLTQTDVNISHAFRFSERFKLKLEATGTNVLNHAAVVSRATQMNRSGNITGAQMPFERFFQPWRVTDYVHPDSTTPAFNPIYGLPGGDPVDGGISHRSGRSDYSSAFLAQNPVFGAYQGPRSFRLGLRLIF